MEEEINSVVPELPWHEGLLKRGGKGGSVNMVKLGNHVLYCYDSKIKNPDKVINLGTIVNIDTMKNKQKFSLEIYNSDKKYDFKARNDASYNEWVDVLRQSIAIYNEYHDNQKRNVRVWLPDLSFINATILNNATTAEELWWLTCEAICIPENKRQSFFMVAVGNNLELRLKCSDIVTDVIDNWSEIETQYVKVEQAPCRIMFKPIPSISIDYESFQDKDEMALHILFSDGIWCLEKAFYDLDVDEAVVLGGLKAQILLGNYDAEPRNAGYIIRILQKLIPTFLLKKKKRRRMGGNVTRRAYETSGKKLFPY